MQKEEYESNTRFGLFIYTLSCTPESLSHLYSTKPTSYYIHGRKMEEKRPPPANLPTLPAELVHNIANFLPNRDIKSLRLTSRFVHNCVKLRLDRVFISANPLNIHVVEEVANHEYFRKGVTEIIWDETYFEWRETTPPNYKYKNNEFRFAFGCPEWYLMRGRSAIIELAESKGNDAVANRPDLSARMRELAAAMPPWESYHYYWNLVKQERWMLRTGADWKVFEYALDRFPSLRRITISTKTHGKLFMPRYKTPLIRSFSYGFVYALPGPWPFPDAHRTSRIMWKDKSADSCKDYRIFRRGLCSALRILAKHDKHKVSEFIVEDHELREGDWHRPYKRFPVQSGEYTIRMDDQGYAFDDLHSLIQRPGFQRLRLHQEHYRHLAKALKNGESLRSLCMYGNERPFRELPLSTPALNYFLALPGCLVQRLHNLVLEKVLVNKNRLVKLLDSMISLQSLELRSIVFEDYGGYELEILHGLSRYRTCNPREFLFDLRDKTGWRYRTLRPTVVIVLSKIFPDWPESQTVKLDSEISDFLYRYCDAPFLPSEYIDPSTGWRHEKFRPVHEYCAGKGIVTLEELDPASERPNVDRNTLKQLGIISAEETRRPNISYGIGSRLGPWGDGKGPWGNEFWGNGPWENRTCPTLQEQGLSEIKWQLCYRNVAMAATEFQDYANAMNQLL